MWSVLSEKLGTGQLGMCSCLIDLRPWKLNLSNWVLFLLGGKNRAMLNGGAALGISVKGV